MTICKVIYKTSKIKTYTPSIQPSKKLKTAKPTKEDEEKEQQQPEQLEEEE
ncbi:hypothetical protein RO3G_16233 [Rhizopus delemar RA 99-880]|uniref:Uncharacterized protein n=1 Tax=Rhizopus delemar (strain RA 99-880 / ATCC MYA-4621 / FGSC 9543 / NRRL 43880) TaxID=246409 RepID=I1CSU2_RHIO9|nr:hypothetical protein RO3G_16233 [Rhizopus delemar RA 99-880]|eukprot:EIE91522.1 hypothetical protein RO3G_16233 [Rhizopus delemar RA 99-880]